VAVCLQTEKDAAITLTLVDVLGTMLFSRPLELVISRVEIRMGDASFDDGLG